jgi:tetratricopeptide (TPR) repeat protein
MKPKIFIGSSIEGLNVAYAIQQNLTNDAEATVWDQGVFELSLTNIESLTDVLGKVDFGVFVFSPDDITNMRGQKRSSVRDNILFEFGLFVGKLSRQRVFFIVPEGEDVKIPTDMLGITPGKYDPNRQDKSYQAATGAFCNQLRTQIRNLGFISPPEGELPAGKEIESKPDLDNYWIDNFIRKEYPEAKEKLETILLEKTEEDTLENRAWLSYINLKIDQKSGFQMLIELSEKNKDKVDIQELVARMLMWEDYSEHAIPIIEKALSIFPGNIKLLLLKAEYLDSIGNTTGAKSTLADAHPEVNPELAIKLSRLYENEKNVDSAINVIHPAYLNYPSNNELMYRYSRLLDAAKRYKEAVYLLNNLTLNDPKNVEYWGYLSNSCLMLELYNQAMISCRKAEELSEGKQAWIIQNIGNMFNNKGFYSEAISLLNKGMTIDPSSQYGHERLAGAIKSKDEEYKKYSEICKEGKILLREYKPKQELESNADGIESVALI